MKKIPIFILTALMLLTTGMATASDSLIIGVAPHTSARVILEMYQPLRIHMEKALGKTVEIVTAPDFDTFARRGLTQEYDIAITTGHQARLFQTDAGYIPFITYKADFKAVAIVAAKGTVKNPSDLKGKDVLGLSQTSLVTLWGKHWLSGNGVKTNPMKFVSASDSVGQLVAAGDAAAGFTSLANYQKLAPELRSKLRILYESKSMSGRVYLLNTRLAAMQQKIDAALWSFAATPEAKKYFETNKLEGYRALRPNELKEMDPYASEVRKFLRANTK